MFKSAYYQFVNFIQGLDKVVFASIWLLLFALILVLIMKFFKKYNGEQKKFEKIGKLFLAIVLFGVMVFLTYIRK